MKTLAWDGNPHNQNSISSAQQPIENFNICRAKKRNNTTQTNKISIRSELFTRETSNFDKVDVLLCCAFVYMLGARWLNGSSGLLPLCCCGLTLSEVETQYDLRNNNNKKKGRTEQKSFIVFFVCLFWVAFQFLSAPPAFGSMDIRFYSFPL